MTYLEELDARVTAALAPVAIGRDLVAGPRHWKLNRCPTDGLKRAGWYQWMAFELPQSVREDIVKRHDLSMSLLSYSTRGDESLSDVMGMSAHTRDSMFAEIRTAVAEQQRQKLRNLLHEIDRWWDEASA